MDPLREFQDEFPASLDPRELRASYEECNFDPLFVKMIAKDVIRVLSPQLVAEPHNLVYDEELVYERLIKPLERYICGLDASAKTDDVKKALNHIQSFNQPKNMCRRILKTGDVTFTCNDCGLDGTCVVCIDCFHKSAHKDHNYKMSNSEGGGCCDCGDVEAWKQHHACTDHMDPNQSSSSLNDFEDRETRQKQILSDKRNILEKINKLPKGVAFRYYIICQAVLQYARKLLSWTDYTSLPTYLDLDPMDDPTLQLLLSKSGTSKNFFTVLYNDEVHTYDQVIGTLVKLIKCTKMTASVIASVVSREGRALIVNDTYKYCRQISEMITNVRDGSQGPLRVEVIHGSVLAHQTYALKLIDWLQKMTGISDAFRILTSYCLLGGPDDTDLESRFSRCLTLAEVIMLSNTDYWKIVRVAWNDLFVKAVLTEYSVKEQFARLLTRNYSDLMRDFIKDDHDHYVSVLTLTTQLYTVPSLICMLVEEEDALYMITRTLVETCKSTKRDNPSMNFENHNTFDMHGLKRGFYIITDLKYLINVKPTKWSDLLRENVIRAAELLLGLLNSMQGMDSVRRQLGQHLEYEPDWEPAMALQSRLTALITRFVTYLSYDEQVLVEAVRMTQSRLLKNGGYKMITKELFGHHVSCIQYDVSALPVSVHLPLTRIAAALILELMRLRVSEKSPYDESLIMLADPIEGRPKHSMVDLMEPCLRTQVMVAQFRSGMWRRNGYSLAGQISYIHLPFLGTEMFDRDILMLQECAAVCEANEFIIHLLNKFQLFTWISSDTTREPLVGPKAVSFHNDEEIMAQTMSLGEEFLQLLLTIISERYRVGVGEVEKEDEIKNEVIQLLCISPMTRSELTQNLFAEDNELDVVKSVAILRRSTKASTGKYELKEEYYSRFNPFFYHYNRRQQSNALDAQLKRKKNLKESLICCPPPRPVTLTKQFGNLRELLRCDISLILIQKILKRTLGFPEHYRECSTKASIWFSTSDLQLDQSLHLIGLGLYEQERDVEGFRFIQSAAEKDIFKLLRDCYEHAKRSKDLIFWIMKKTLELIGTIGSATSSSGDQRELDVIESIKGYFEPALEACDNAKQDSKKRNSELAAQRRDRILAMMKANQDKFLSSPATKQLVAKEAPISRKAEETSHLCILCRDEQKINLENPTMVLLAYIQRSSVLSKNKIDRRIPNYALTPSNQIKHQLWVSTWTRPVRRSPEVYSYTSDNGWSYDATFMPSDLFFGPHISTCGHAMHFDCWQGYFDAIVKRETSRPNRNSRRISFELEKNEILCPLCECISNATIPILPNYVNNAGPISVFGASPGTIAKSSENLSNWLRALRGTVDMFNHVRHINPTESSTLLSRNADDKYIRTLQPKLINQVLEELGEKEALHLRNFMATIRNDKIEAKDCSRSMLISIANLADRLHTVALDLDKSVVDVHHARKFMMTTWTVSYTIQSQERLCRFKGIPIFEELESSKNLCLSSLTKFACSSVITHHPDMMQSLLIQKLRYLLVSDEYLSASPCCLDIDIFETFVSVMILLQLLYYHIDDFNQDLSAKKAKKQDESSEWSPNTSLSSWITRALNHEYFRNLLHLTLVMNLLQVIITMQNEEPIRDKQKMQEDDDMCTTCEEADSTQIRTQEIDALQSFYQEVILTSGHPNSQAPKVDERLCSKVRHRLLPYLRSCALFYFHLTQIKPPEALQTCSAFFEGREFMNPLDEITDEFKDARQSFSPREGEFDVDLETTNSEYEAICQYLDLPNNFSLLLQSQEARHLAHSWLRHSRVLVLIKSALKKDCEARRENEQKVSELMPVRFIRQPHSVNRLVDLPYDYSELVDKVSNFTCPSIKNEDSRTPTMCLVCGVILCSQSFCCQRDLNELASNYQLALQRQRDNLRAQSETSSQPEQSSTSRVGSQLMNTNLVMYPSVPGLVNSRGHPMNALAIGNASIERANGLTVISVGASGGSIIMGANISNASTSGSGSHSAQAHSWPSLNQQLVGSCTYHAHECSAGVGVFLRIRTCQILLLSSPSKGCYLDAPYIDDHGETDYNLVRGNPLHLNRQLYEKLQHMWLNHAIPEQISRMLEYSSYGSGQAWLFH